MDLIGTLRSFLRVADTGSFSAVAFERGITQPAISRQVSALEAHLGVRLVQRSTQAVVLTDEGRDLIAAAQALVDSADSLMQAAARRLDRPVGRVRIAAPVALGMFLCTQIHQLLDAHPELEVELVLRDHGGGLLEDGLDAEIRLGRLSDSSLVSRPLGFTDWMLVAAPRYLGNCPPLTHPRDLASHECIVHHREGRMTSGHSASRHAMEAVRHPFECEAVSVRTTRRPCIWLRCRARESHVFRNG